MTQATSAAHSLASPVQYRPCSAVVPEEARHDRQRQEAEAAEHAPPDPIVSERSRLGIR